MKLRTKETLKEYFKTDLKPTQDNFGDWLDSYWHKDEEIPFSKIKDYSLGNVEISDVTDLENQLSNKTDEAPNDGEKYVRSNKVWTKLEEATVSNIEISNVNGLSGALGNKADLVDGKVPEAQLPGLSGDVTRHRAHPTVTEGKLVLDFNEKNELIVSKAGGGGIVVNSDFEFELTNTTNAEFCQGFLTVSKPIKITIPIGSVSANELDIKAGRSQFVFSNDGHLWHFSISNVES